MEVCIVKGGNFVILLKLLCRKMELTFYDSFQFYRCKDVFSSLDALEQKHQQFEKSRAREDAEIDKQLINQSACIEGDSGNSTIFKRPTFTGVFIIYVIYVKILGDTTMSR